MALKNRTYIFVFIAMLLGAFYFHYAPSTAPRSAMAVNIDTELETHSLRARLTKNQAHGIKKTSGVTSSPTAIAPTLSTSPFDLSDENFQLFSEWQKAHGYPQVDQDGNYFSNAYEYYSNETLATMANQGDSQAMLLYAQAKMRDADFATAEDYLINASVHGYTLSLSELASIKLMQSKMNQSAGNHAQAEEQQHEALAWLEVGAMRGDRVINFNKDNYYQQFQLDEAVRADITKKAKALYEQLSQKRANLNLEEFDNSYPKALEGLYTRTPTTE